MGSLRLPSGMTYLRGDAAVFDSWEELGNQGWNWESLFPYFKKSEQYIAPSEDQMLTGASYEPDSHGSEGSVHVGYPANLQSNNYSDAVQETWKKLSVDHSPDLNSGIGRGFNIGPQTLDPELNRRWDSARAYYIPVEDRPNLKILKGTVKRITWAEEKHGGSCKWGCDVVADGVEYLTEDGKSHIVKAGKEVVVSAGSFRSPLVLEGSGIGSPRYGSDPNPSRTRREAVANIRAHVRILERLGIEAEVDLPGVGENLQEQPSHTATYQGLPYGIASAYHAFLTARDLFGDDFLAAEESTRTSIPKWAQLAVEASKNGDLNVTAVAHLLTLQHNLLFKEDIPLAEILQVGVEGIELKGSQTWMLFAFSRGSVHLGSVEDINAPLFDPRVFLADFDFETCTAAARLARRFWMTEPMNGFVTGIAPPLDEELPEDATDEQWKAFIMSGGLSPPSPDPSRSCFPWDPQVPELTKSLSSHASWPRGRHVVDDVAGARRSGGSGAEGVRHRQRPCH